MKKNKDRKHSFGEKVDGYDIRVLNEREIRASAGLLFLVLMIAVVFILFKQDFLMIKYVIITFFADFMIRVWIDPRFSPSLILGRLIVSRQVPEYVGAPQKKFAWTIGLILSGLMLILLVILNSYSIITGITCMVCLAFLFFESAFGICLGCRLYDLFYKNRLQYCPGGSCEPPEKHKIQNTSAVQLIIVFLYMVFLFLTIRFFNHTFQAAPRNLKEIFSSSSFMRSSTVNSRHIAAGAAENF
jgi:hypothetical protein